MVKLHQEQEVDIEHHSSQSGDSNLSVSDSSTNQTPNVDKEQNKSPSKTEKKDRGLEDYQFSVIDTFYAFKSQVLPQSDSNFSLLKHLLVCET